MRHPEVGGIGPEQPHNYMPAYFICPTPEEELVKETVSESQSQADRVEYPPLLSTTSTSREGVQLKAASQHPHLLGTVLTSI